MSKTKITEVMMDDKTIDASKEIAMVFSIANTLRGPYKPDKYKDVIIPMIILRRLECALAPTKKAVVDAFKKNPAAPAQLLCKKSGYQFYNTCEFDLKKLLTEAPAIVENLTFYIESFSPNVQAIFEELKFKEEIKNLDKNNRLLGVVKKFSELELDPEKVDNVKMGYMFEEIIRRFSENASAGDHYTPREVIRLLTSILLAEGCSDIFSEGREITVLDMACGTGGMLSTAHDFIVRMNPDANVRLFGQENSPESHAICLADMLIKNQAAENIRFADTMKEDCFEDTAMRFVIANPPFGEAWGGKDAGDGVEKAVRKEHKKGKDGRFSAGLPATGDMQLLFMQHAVAKMQKGVGIKSLLVNHTFVFLGYSLNDNNLNLIIGWINYFRELHGIEARPANFWIDSKPSTPFEQARLENRNIYVVDLSSLPSDLEVKATVPASITNDTGRKLFTFLRCITNPKIIYQYIPLEDRIVEKYQLLKSYSKISHQDLIAVHPLGRTQFLDTELIFYDKPWYECIQKLLSDKESTVSEVFRRAGISAIHFYNDDSHFPVPNAYEPLDPLFQLYFDNDYIALNTELENCKDLVQKMYYSNVLGKDKKYVEMLLSTIEELKPPTDYVSVLLYKMRARIATLSHFERQESKTLELQRAFNTSPPEKYKNAVSFLRMLFDSPAKNMQKMEEILSTHEKRYAFNNRTTYFDHSHIGIWELKAFAYDYYFFFKENGIPLDYFSEPKEYLSYYLKALLCSYSPESRDSDKGTNQRVFLLVFDVVTFFEDNSVRFLKASMHFDNITVTCLCK